ncbi:MAG: DUF4394 domain-containing protein, partial [Blastocatellia bacterium]
SAPTAAQQAASIARPNVNIYALNADNTIFVLAPGDTGFNRLVRVNKIIGNLIGLDFRPADGNPNSVYGLTDTGNLYTINLSSANLGVATLISTQSPRFAGGFQSLMDFNPMVNALRLIGTNDQNFALVNSNGNLNLTAVQTALSYNPGDVNFGVDPNITGGSYTNNFVGAPNTLFYAIDYDLDTFVTIAPASPGGSSATGGGKLQTIGRVTDPSGNLINFSPTADIDIYTDANGVNGLMGMSGRTMFSIDLAQINQSLALGTTQKVVANAVTMAEPGGGFIDIAVATNALAAAPAPTPTPAPAPAATPTPAPIPISPMFECVTDNFNGTFTLQFGYHNLNSYTVTVPAGDNNKYIPAKIGFTPPTTFLPGRQRNVVRLIHSGGNLVWAVNGVVAIGSIIRSPRCPR